MGNITMLGDGTCCPPADYASHSSSAETTVFSPAIRPPHISGMRRTEAWMQNLIVIATALLVWRMAHAEDVQQKIKEGS